MLQKYLSAAIVVLLLAAPAESRETSKDAADASSNMLPISAALHAKSSKIALRSDVKLYFGDHGPTSAATASLGIAYARGEANATAKSKSNTKSHKDEPACKEAMRSALARLIEQAREWKGNAVMRIVSYYNSIERASATNYECHVDASHAVVELRGEVVTLGRKK